MAVIRSHPDVSSSLDALSAYPDVIAKPDLKQRGGVTRRAADAILCVVPRLASHLLTCCAVL